MNLQQARSVICGVPSTSGRTAMAEALGRVAPIMDALFSRGFASLVGSGIPSPRPDVALHLSTPHGGHINRMIITSESTVELDHVLHKFRKLLRPANIGAAVIKLEHLRRYEQSTSHSHKVLRVASELHKYVDTYVDRLSLTQISNVVRGMSSVQYRLPPSLLVRLAAGVVADGGVALRFSADCDVRDVFYGFAGQGFTNPLFWSRLCAETLPRLGSFDPNTLPAIVKALERARQLPAAAAAVTESPSSSAGSAVIAVNAASPQVAVARTALRLLSESLKRLQPGRLADISELLVHVAPAVDAVRVDECLVAELQAATLPFLPSLSPDHLTRVLLSLLYLRHSAAMTSITPKSTSTSNPTSGEETRPPPLSPLPANLMGAAEPHLRAAAPKMRLLHVKRAVQALAPSVAAHAAGAGLWIHRSALGNLLNILARRAALLLPSTVELTAGAPRLLARGTLSHLPRGGNAAGVVLAALLPAGDPRVALDTPLLGLLEGLVRAYSFAIVPPGGKSAAVTTEPADAKAVRTARQQQLPDVAVLFGRVVEVAAAGLQRGLLAEAQRVSLLARLPLLLPDDAVAPLRRAVGVAGVGYTAAVPSGSSLLGLQHS